MKEDEVLIGNFNSLHADSNVAMDVVADPDHLSNDTPMVSNSVTVATESSIVLKEATKPKQHWAKKQWPKKSASQYRCTACGKNCFDIDR